MTTNFMIYGANGYTGELTARNAVKQGLHPILAGRNKAAVEEVAGRLDLEARSFSLDDPAAIDVGLKDVDAVLHMAGPFTETFRQMAEACLRTKTHYLDITGEPDVYLGLQKLDAQAKEAGVMFLPGIGFDVVPTDCLALHLKNRLPSATHLALAFRMYGPADLSHGTTNTFINHLDRTSLIRQNGELVSVPHLSKSWQIDFGRGEEEIYRMVWGDLITAYHSTGIPNIENYFAISNLGISLLKMSKFFRPLMGAGFVKNFLKKQATVGPAGPSDEEIEKSNTVVWGEAKDAAGNTVVSRLNAPEAYYLTAITSLLAAKRVLSGDAPVGYQTPATAYGADFILEVEGVEREDLN